MTKAMIEQLVQALGDSLRKHHHVLKLQADYKATVHQAVEDTDRAALGMKVLVAGLPKLVKDQLPKIGQTRLNWDNDKHRKLLESVKTLGIEGEFDLPDASPFANYSGENVDFPDGEVLFTKEADTLRPLTMSEGSVRAWAKVIQAKWRIKKAGAVIDKATAHLEQLLYEFGTLEKVMQGMPTINHLIPASWLEEKPAAAPTNLVDPETAARLRAFILGEEEA